MTALQIADIKSFMKKFLLTDSFDRFLLLEGAVTTRSEERRVGKECL